jgi:hypothetical protein
MTISREISWIQMQAEQQAAVVADILPEHLFHGHLLSLAHGTGVVLRMISTGERKRQFLPKPYNGFGQRA